jgi:hypothetical protein
MKLDATKIELIEWLTKLDDKAVLSSLLFFKKSTETMDWADDLSPEQRNRVEEGLADIKAGRTVTSEKFWAKYGRKI